MAYKYVALWHLCLPVQNLRGKKGEARARQVVETSLILLEGRAASSDKQLDSLLETLQEVGQGSPVRMMRVLLQYAIIAYTR